MSQLRVVPCLQGKAPRGRKDDASLRCGSDRAGSDPAPVAEWLPYLAAVAGAKPPLRMPARLGRLLAGAFVVALMTRARGSSNEKARKALGWEPRYASWREGFRAWVGG
jgi:2-alkyl-3-oxoalkanoate reductase